MNNAIKIKKYTIAFCKETLVNHLEFIISLLKFQFFKNLFGY